MNETGMTAIDTRQKFYGIDVVRGVATCLVVFAHGGYIQSEARYGGQAAFDGGIYGLFVCVDFFFVLSGFLIAWVHWSDIGQRHRIGRYFKRRLARIYPVYWVVLTFFVIAHYFHPAHNPVPLTPKLLITSYLVIPNDGPTILGVAWTLYYEIWCYLVFGFLLFMGKRGFYVLFAWTIAIVAFYLTSIEKTFPLAFFLNPYNLQFLMGVGLAYLVRNRRIPWPRTVAFIGCGSFLVLILFNAGTVFSDDPLKIRVVMGLLACLGIGGLMEAERSKLLSIPGWMQNFGAASYSIYLVHTVVLGPFMQHGWPILRHLTPELRAFVSAVVAIAIGYVFHRLVELPLTEIVKNLILTEKPRVERAGA
jgi:peptidoglycan/LPS O-acetylase OafA/YrhL